MTQKMSYPHPVEAMRAAAASIDEAAHAAAAFSQAIRQVNAGGPRPPDSDQYVLIPRAHLDEAKAIARRVLNWTGRREPPTPAERARALAAIEALGEGE